MTLNGITDAATAIAEAVIELAAASRTHRRLFLREHFGVSPKAVFERIEPTLNEEITFDSVPNVRLAAYRIGTIQLIPYLVQDLRGVGNIGLRGFAGTLRTEFMSGTPDGMTRVLLILDERPFETVLSAAEDVGGLPPLSWSRLLQRIAKRSTGPAVGVLLAVVEDLSSVPESWRSEIVLNEMAAFSARSFKDATDVGLHLSDISLYLNDPTPNGLRLRQSREWRRELAAWSLPDKDLAIELTRYAGTRTPGIDKVVSALGVTGLAWDRFTLDDLPPRKSRAGATLANPPAIVGSNGHIAKGSTVVAQVSLDSEALAIRFTGTAAAAKPTIQWGTQEPVDASVNEADLLIEFPIPGRGSGGWHMGRLDWPRGGSVNVAAYRSSQSWFPVEAEVVIDPVAEAFVPGEPVQVLAVDTEGAVLGDAEVISDLSQGDPGDVIDAHVRFGNRPASIPMQVQMEEPEPPDDPGPGGPEGPGGPGDPEPPDDDPRVDGGITRSGAHALLDLAGRRIRQGMTVPTASLSFNAGAEPSISGDGALFALESQSLVNGRSDIDGLDLERQIFAQPSALAFTVGRGAGGPRLKPDESLERLSLGAFHPSMVEDFLRARTSYFHAITQSGKGPSVHATLCGVGEVEAWAYVDTYAKLLDSIPVPGQYEAEYDRLLLVDLVSDPTTGHCWIAPTNPVTVAWALELARAAAAWSQEGAQFPARDLSALAPTFLLPLFHAAGTWWEIDPRSPLLWRWYRPLGSSLAVGGGDYKTITRRIEKFLAIFPEYADPKQQVAISLHEPGDGGSAAEALRNFYKEEQRADANFARPHLNVSVFSGDGELPSALADLVAPDNDDEVDRLVRSRITLTSLSTHDEPSFAHLSFVFRSPAAREPRLLRLSDRCPTDWIDGLAAAPGRRAQFGANEMSFASGLFVDPNKSSLAQLLGRTLELVGGQPRGYLQPGFTQTTTTTVDTSSMESIYRSSVWTTHADRLLGPEAFSTGRNRSLTIVDFDDRSTYWQAGLDSVTVTARVEPYRMALTRAFAPVTELQRSALSPLIEMGNAVSGRWNLDLLSLSLNGVRERIGVLAAIASLRDLDQAFRIADEDSEDLGGILLPLDELFLILPASGIKRPSSRSCDDLMYVRVRRAARGRMHLVARLLEVKFTTTGQPDLGIARRELETTRSWLDGAFNVRTPARKFRSRDLAEFVRSGAIRNGSFGLPGMDQEEVERVAEAISRGSYELILDYKVGGQKLSGDVVSLELENPVLARRQDLPGEGLPMGYVRLGAPAFQHLAVTGSLPRPGDWRPPVFPAGPVEDPPEGGETSESASGEATTRPTSASSGDQSVPLPADAAPAAGHTEATLDPALEEEVSTKAAELDGAAAKYGLQLAPFDKSLVQVGPSVIRFRTRLLGKQTIAGIRTKSLDLGREVGVAEGLLVDQEPYYVTVDVPRRERVVVPLYQHMSELAAINEPGSLPFLLGMAPSGVVRVKDLARLPHLLVAGATGSGKSVLLRGLLCCLVYTRSPMQLQILIIDPKQVDFMPFENLAHLVDQRIVTDPVEAIDVLSRTLEREVAWRRNKLKDAGATSALDYYERGGAVEDLPQMVILVDEFADLAAALDRRDREAFMSLIQRYGQLTRAFGIYLVLATQRPSVQVITGDIKANLTARVALKVQSAVDSTTILGRGGAEALRDRGDLLFDHGGVTERLQGFFASLDDVRAATARWTS